MTNQNDAKERPVSHPHTASPHAPEGDPHAGGHPHAAADPHAPDQAAIDASLGRPAGEPTHSGTGGMLNFPAPLGEPEIGGRRTPAEEARTVAESTRLASLATVGEDGSPWSSVVGYGLMADGSLSLVLSELAEHGRNLARDPRASVSMVAPLQPGQDPLDASRVTLVGRVEVPEGVEAQRALETHCEAYPAARAYARFGDFTLYVLRVERIRWVGGFGRMDSAGGADYALAEADPTAPAAADAVDHLNTDHADALLLMAQELAAYGDATAAKCDRIDRYGLDLAIRTLRGVAPARVGFSAPVGGPEGLRSGTVELTRRARAKRQTADAA